MNRISLSIIASKLGATGPMADEIADVKDVVEEFVDFVEKRDGTEPGYRYDLEEHIRKVRDVL